MISTLRTTDRTTGKPLVLTVTAVKCLHIIISRRQQYEDDDEHHGHHGPGVQCASQQEEQVRLDQFIKTLATPVRCCTLYCYHRTSSEKQFLNISMIGGKLFYDLKSRNLVLSAFPVSKSNGRCLQSTFTKPTTKFFSFHGSPCMNPDVKSSIF